MVSFRSSRTFFKKQKIYSEAAAHSLKSKRYIQKQLHKSSLCYRMFINRVHLMLFILKQHLLLKYRFTIKQAGLVVIKRKAFRNHTLFVPLQRFSSASLSIFLYAYIFALKATNSAMIYPPSSSFMRPIFFLFFPMVSSLLSSFEYPLVSNLFSTSFAISL